ncbi:MAG: YicC family protein [Bacteroidetes bacterium]|nr:YicC family protein [Bacteroidota bacterium]
MTGYGKSVCEFRNRKVVVEIKSLNSKQLDVNYRIANGFREKEIEIRNIVSERLQRGKIDIVITVENEMDFSNYVINKELAKKYYRELKEITSEFEDKSSSDYLNVVMRMPDVLVPEKDEVTRQEWDLLISSMNSAIDDVEKFRMAEGSTLGIELQSRNSRILSLLEEISPFEKLRMETLKLKITKDLYDIAKKEDIDKNRFEQELVYYQDKLDITEEKFRLIKHCEYFIETLTEANSQGKKLSFIAQEMGREINTLGSKASDVNIQKIVVQMKDELEKIKEQLFNIL